MRAYIPWPVVHRWHSFPPFCWGSKLQRHIWRNRLFTRITFKKLLFVRWRELVGGWRPILITLKISRARFMGTVRIVFSFRINTILYFNERKKVFTKPLIYSTMRPGNKIFWLEQLVIQFHWPIVHIFTLSTHHLGLYWNAPASAHSELTPHRQSIFNDKRRDLWDIVGLEKAVGVKALKQKALVGRIWFMPKIWLDDKWMGSETSVRDKLF